MPGTDGLPLLNLLNLHQVNNSQKQQTPAARTALLAAIHLPARQIGVPSEEAQNRQLPSIPEGRVAHHDVKASSFRGSADLPMLPLVTRTSEHTDADAYAGR